MPRVTKPKVAAAKKDKSKLYAMPEKIKEGTILTDIAKEQWYIGPSIGIGGFGEIYATCRKGEKNYDAVVKCEPHGNGPLFVEMHFYLRNAKLDDINKFKQEHGLKSLGMPYIIANGSVEINGLKHRFIVMPRYGSDLAKFFVLNGNRLPEITICRLALQMLDVYQYIHSTGYVHADLKAANILLGLGRNGGSQAYLVDFGLASHYATSGDFKPDLKKMHNGTIEYTSRDAHMGVATRRSDLETLGYNLIEWLGVELPWIKDKLLSLPTKVYKAKEAFMADVNASLELLFPKDVPACIDDYMKYVAKLTHNEAPDYGRCRKFFINALKQMKVANCGDLELKLKSQDRNPQAKKAISTRARPQKDDVIIDFNEDQQADVDCMPRNKLSAVKPTLNLLPKAEKAVVKPAAASLKEREEPRYASPPRTSAQKRIKMAGNEMTNVQIVGGPGKTIINDGLSPQPQSNKTYEFNFELDVSIDANVIVNVKRKKKPQTASPSSECIETPGRVSSTPRFNLRKIKVENLESSSTSTTAVPVRKHRH